MLIAFICILMLPIPYLLSKYGPRLRKDVGKLGCPKLKMQER